MMEQYLPIAIGAANLGLIVLLILRARKHERAMLALLLYLQVVDNEHRDTHKLVGTLLTGLQSLERGFLKLDSAKSRS